MVRAATVCILLFSSFICSCANSHIPADPKVVLLFDRLDQDLCRMLADKTAFCIISPMGAFRGKDGCPVHAQWVDNRWHSVYCWIEPHLWKASRFAKDGPNEIIAYAVIDEAVTDEEWGRIMGLFETKYRIKKAR